MQSRVAILVREVVKGKLDGVIVGLGGGLKPQQELWGTMWSESWMAQEIPNSMPPTRGLMEVILHHPVGLSQPRVRLMDWISIGGDGVKLSQLAVTGRVMYRGSEHPEWFTGGPKAPRI